LGSNNPHRRLVVVTERKRTVRCAVYTRKSSEEGLDQSFNSLDAQREACVAYVTSQRHEGWKALDTLYDDGGYSGGTLERPALRQLLSDIDARQIDAVVVYKVDRLTRSLADFAKIVEIFDAKGVSFVSVTQHFNTTSSMGRLTLNVLLSFAQFEREVTGERIRDKIAASKRKGMWMGGPVPLGYDAKDRQLEINPDEAKIVQLIFTRYAELGAVKLLLDELNVQGIHNKRRVNRAGQPFGGGHFERGALYHLLQNPLYLGIVTHRGQSFPGQHAPIIAKPLWEAVQAILVQNRTARAIRKGATQPSLLAGLLYDEFGNRLTPSHAVKHGKRYRYYVSQAVIQGNRFRAGTAQRLPAHALEKLVCHALQDWLVSEDRVLSTCAAADDTVPVQRQLIQGARGQADQFRGEASEVRAWLCAAVSRIEVSARSVRMELSRGAVRSLLLGTPDAPLRLKTSRKATAPSEPHDALSIEIPANLKRVRGGMRLVVANDSNRALQSPNKALIKAIAQGLAWFEKMTTGQAKSLKALAAEAGTNRKYVSRLMRAALLAPDLIEMVLQGSQPPEITVETLYYHLPMDWNEQRRLFSVNSPGS